ncbi:hypothetical protein AA98_5235 [Escherichia coli 2-011-08_S1_C1]|nr:hypothetical protein AA98_5235 [Escherichia coli 2-011-08_S1_C1]
MPQLARASASLRRPGASQQGGALYCACEHRELRVQCYSAKTF